ncbi:MAG: hypothetical protein ACW98Y_16110 [Candidatus Thorarchaeota archaeon]
MSYVKRKTPPHTAYSIYHLYAKKHVPNQQKSGSNDGNQASVVIEGFGEDLAMLPTTIEEISFRIESWICKHYGDAIDVEGVALIF